MLALVPNVMEGSTLKLTYVPGKARRSPVGSKELGVFEGTTFDQPLRQHRHLQPHRQQLLGGRERLAIPPRWKPVASCRRKGSAATSEHIRGGGRTMARSERIPLEPTAGVTTLADRCR